MDRQVCCPCLWRVLSVSVEGAMGVGCVFVTRFCAVAARCGLPPLCCSKGDCLSEFLDAHPLGCHLVDGEKFLRGMDHCRCETSCTLTPAIADRSGGGRGGVGGSFFSPLFYLFCFFHVFHCLCFSCFLFFIFFHFFIFFIFRSSLSLSLKHHFF